jgi:hypothetical protein
MNAGEAPPTALRRLEGAGTCKIKAAACKNFIGEASAADFPTVG